MKRTEKASVYIGDQLRLLRQAREWTQAELARQAGCSASMIASLERGTCGMSVGLFLRLCRALQCKPAELLKDQ